MLIRITRHGQPVPFPDDGSDPDFPPGDPPLSDLGRRQAEKLAAWLEAAGFRGEIHASPYLRTAVTADIVARALGLSFRPEAALREVVMPSISSFAGLDRERLLALCPHMDPAAPLEWPWWTTAPEPPDPDGNGNPSVEKRVGEFLARACSPAGPDILLVGHGATASAACRLLDRDASDSQPAGEFNPGAHWNCALSVFRLEPGGLFRLARNAVSHLDPDEVTSNSRTRS